MMFHSRRSISITPRIRAAFATGCGALLFALCGYGASEFEPSRGDLEKMRKETQQAIRQLQYFHYSKEPVSNIDPEEMLVSYMKELDYSRLFFLERDKEEVLGRFGMGRRHSNALIAADLMGAV